MAKQKNQTRSRKGSGLKLTQERNALLVRTGAGASLGKTKPLKVEVLTENVTIFLGQMNSIVSSTPESVGGFKLTEIEVSAEITGSGELSLLGAGISAEASGGLKFKFRKGAPQHD